MTTPTKEIELREEIHNILTEAYSRQDLGEVWAISEIESLLNLAVQEADERSEKNRWSMPCEGCSEGHPSFWKTIIESCEWHEWEKIANEQGFDYDESRELGALSPAHWSAFVNYITK